EKFSDVCFVVEGEKFHAHKAILAAGSPYFETMLFGETNESKMNKITLSHTSKQSLKAVLQYARKGFTKSGEFTPLQLLSLLSLVHEYQFDELFQD
ncbi:BTB/POZ domain protein-like protein, partial [Dinothrombium tinctorium]